jgi:hypothetical protein
MLGHGNRAGNCETGKEGVSFMVERGIAPIIYQQLRMGLNNRALYVTLPICYHFFYALIREDGSM